MVAKPRLRRWIGLSLLASGLALSLSTVAGAQQPPPPYPLPPLPEAIREPRIPASGEDDTPLPGAAPAGPAVIPPDVRVDDRREGAEPRFLNRPLDAVADALRASPFAEVLAPFRTPINPTPGFSGPSGILPREPQTTADFVPVEDRWRIGYPAWDRYDRKHPIIDDYPYAPGSLLDPYNQNVLKGDYPIVGQHTFLEITGVSNTLTEGRTVPTQTTPFESTSRQDEYNFFGRPKNFIFQQNFILSVDLNHGDAAFKPTDWRIHITPIFNINNASFSEVAQVSPNVLQGQSRTRTWVALQEWFLEMKLADTSPHYDFVSMRLGAQPFISDFRGFLYADVNRGARLFGTANSNRDQFNLIYMSQQEKDTNSFLNTFNNREQNLIFANWYRQDFIFPGYTIQGSVNYLNDQPTFKFDKNRFLVRPDPTGVFQPHQIDVAYLGFAGDGHIGRFNLTHQFYWALGYDRMNPIANRGQQVDAKMFAVEGSYDRDWARFKVSYFYASGDGNPNNSRATGFDTILDLPQFAGGQFSFWQRQNLPLFGVQLTQRNSLVADLRSSKIQGQPNFVNPGVQIVNFGVDMDLTPKLKMFNNVNLLWFDKTAVLEQFLYAGNIKSHIGTDLSTGVEYRPLLSENVVFVAGVAGLFQGQGLRNLYNNLDSRVNPFGQLFANVVLAY